MHSGHSELLVTFPVRSKTSKVVVRSEISSAQDDRADVTPAVSAQYPARLEGVGLSALVGGLGSGRHELRRLLGLFAEVFLKFCPLFCPLLRLRLSVLGLYL